MYVMICVSCHSKREIEDGKIYEVFFMANYIFE